MTKIYSTRNVFSSLMIALFLLPSVMFGNFNFNSSSFLIEEEVREMGTFNLVSIDEQNLAKLNRITQIVTTFDVNKAYAGPKLKDGRYFVKTPTKYTSKPIKQIRSNLGFAVTSYDDESEASNLNDCCDFVDGKPVALSFTYLGGGCDASNNSQGSKTECTGGVGSPQMISIIASDKEDGSGDIYFSGDVALGESFTISNNGDNFSSELFVRINDGAEILNIHTSCSAPLVGGEIFGSLKFDGLVTDKGEVCGEGDFPPPVQDCCDVVNGKPVSLSFSYLGGGCDASNNTQGDKTECTGGIGSPQIISVVASNKEDGSGDIYFSGDVALGDAFIISNNGDNFSSELFVRINDGAEILNIHTSCSAPLVSGEIFGSLKLNGLLTDDGEVCGE
ncbi:MAG: hypothetical protein HKP24_01665, partial [Croceitalea sp.]|nr:hypothetical protein [Croceitalea sp.]